ncbi:hypothetical protein [Arthrobacter sp. 162MFSha1.1]|uniref:hypothetical protein n=1 Tax=Arthrobacter sp. 162MFSha1.1 TaxID=1151119 RepID=UPI0012DC6E14|nr:hypothetical protein [Arthrobacter sp. 162MFSha1.1]
MATLNDAFQRLQDDNALAKAFMDDPTATLNQLQVDTTNVDVQTVFGSLPVKPGEAVAKAGSICLSAGVKGVCLTVGAVVVIDQVNAPPQGPLAPE